MKLDLSFTEADGYLLVRVEGEWTPDAVQHGIEEIANAAQEIGNRCVLLDTRKLSAPKAGFHRFLAGQQIAEAFQGRFKIAVVSPAELIDKFAEHTAVNRGAQIKVLSDVDEALTWLMENPATG